MAKATIEEKREWIREYLLGVGLDSEIDCHEVAKALSREHGLRGRGAIPMTLVRGALGGLKRLRNSNPAKFKELTGGGNGAAAEKEAAPAPEISWTTTQLLMARGFANGRSSRDARRNYGALTSLLEAYGDANGVAEALMQAIALTNAAGGDAEAAELIGYSV